MGQPQPRQFNPDQIAQIRQRQEQEYQPRNEDPGAFGTVFGNPASQQLWGRNRNSDGTPSDRLFGNQGRGNASQLLFSGQNASQGLWGNGTPSNMLFGNQGNASQGLFGGAGNASQQLWGRGGMPSQALFGGQGNASQQLWGNGRLPSQALFGNRGQPPQPPVQPPQNYRKMMRR